MKKYCDAFQEEDARLSFRIPLADTDIEDADQSSAVPEGCVARFRNDGFIVAEEVLSMQAVNLLNDRLEDVLRGDYDRGNKPDKAPKLLKIAKPEFVKTTELSSHSNKKKRASRGGPIGFTGNLQNVKVLQIINIHKSDTLFRRVETFPILGSIVAQLAGWECGARLAQDQVWAKPPGAAPLVFHRDTPYFMFSPSDVVTVWIALDDMEEELGPLEYVPGSHKWGDGRVGSASQFFQGGTKNLLKSAAEREGIDWVELEVNIVSMAGLRAGGLSIHDGKMWHGSAKNSSRTKPRRGLGLHFVPANIHFTSEANHSRLWRPYVEDADDSTQVEISDEDFPLVGQKYTQS